VIIPDKIQAHYLIEMIESNLLNFKQLHPWADKLIAELDSPPAWICDVSVTKYQPDVAKIVRGYVYELEIVERPYDLEKFHVGCLWLRYMRREISWATLLHFIGNHLDAANGGWACEIPYEFLNIFEDGGYSVELEAQTRKIYLSKVDVKKHIIMARTNYFSYVKQKSTQQGDAPERFAPGDL